MLWQNKWALLIYLLNRLFFLIRSSEIVMLKIIVTTYSNSNSTVFVQTTVRTVHTQKSIHVLNCVSSSEVHPGQVTRQIPMLTQRQSFTPMTHLEPLITLTLMSLDCGRKPEYPERSHESTERTWKLHAKSSNSETSHCEAAVRKSSCHF